MTVWLLLLNGSQLFGSLSNQSAHTHTFFLPGALFEHISTTRPLCQSLVKPDVARPLNLPSATNRIWRISLSWALKTMATRLAKLDWDAAEKLMPQLLRLTFDFMRENSLSSDPPSSPRLRCTGWTVALGSGSFCRNAPLVLLALRNSFYILLDNLFLNCYKCSRCLSSVMNKPAAQIGKRSEGLFACFFFWFTNWFGLFLTSQNEQ